jgi:hypothetical protein
MEIKHRTTALLLNNAETQDLLDAQKRAAMLADRMERRLSDE